MNVCCSWKNTLKKWHAFENVKYRQKLQQTPCYVPSKENLCKKNKTKTQPLWSTQLLLYLSPKGKCSCRNMTQAKNKYEYASFKQTFAMQVYCISCMWLWKVCSFFFFPQRTAAVVTVDSNADPQLWKTKCQEVCKKIYSPFLLLIHMFSMFPNQ